MARIYTVAFYRKGTELLVNVCNFADASVDEELTLDLKKIGLAAG